MLDLIYHQRKLVSKVLILVFCLSSLHSINAQVTPSDAQITLSGCTGSLENARNAYRSGQLKRVKTLLKECLDKDLFTNQQKRDALRLLVLSNIYWGINIDIVSSMTAFLKHHPKYQITMDDPPEFVSLYERFITKPILTTRFDLGAVYSLPQILLNLGTDNELTNNQKYSGNVGYGGNLLVNVYITRNIYAVTGLSLMSNTITLVDEFGTLPTTSLESREHYNTLSLPLGIGYGTNSLGNSPWKLFFEAGTMGNYLLSATTDLKITFSQRTGVDIKSMRKNWDYSVFGRFGVQRYIDTHLSLYAAFTYIHMLNSIVPFDRSYENRGTTNELDFVYGYTNNFFVYHNINFSLGFSWDFYIVRQKKEYRR